MPGTDNGRRRCSPHSVASLPSKLDLSQMPKVLSLLAKGEPIGVPSAHARLFGAVNSSHPGRVAWTPGVIAASQRAIAEIFGNILMRSGSEGSLLATEHIKSILSSLDSPVAVLDPAGDIIAVNERWMGVSHTGGNPGKLEVGKNYLDAIRDLVPKSDELLRGVESVCSGTGDSFETEYAIPVGSETLCFAVSVSPFKGPTGGAVVIHRDITERKRAEDSIREMSGRLIRAQEDERSRIGRELHDDINQQLALLGLRFNAWKRPCRKAPPHCAPV